ncbi:MAG: hypothetical protein NWE95_07510 [Candidatus Bathyarchaeota archaeon]|nr:hypothetical protein [Candidatus Bathyarchaeota archaeon]
MTLIIAAAGLLSFGKTNLPVASDNVPQTNKTDTVQQQPPPNKTATEAPSQTFPSPSTNTVDQPGGSVIPTNVGIYSDSACTQPLTSIDWGSFSPGSSVKRTLYVKNTQNTPLALNMSTTNWAPTQAAESITITWDKENVTLASQQSTAATLTLTVASSVRGISQFSVAIVITGR